MSPLPYNFYLSLFFSIKSGGNIQITFRKIETTDPTKKSDPSLIKQITRPKKQITLHYNM